MTVFRSKLLIVNQETPGHLLQGFGPKVFSALKYYGQTLPNCCNTVLLFLASSGLEEELFFYFLESITVNNQHVKTPFQP